jgi:hypothetical protein
MRAVDFDLKDNSRVDFNCNDRFPRVRLLVIPVLHIACKHKYYLLLMDSYYSGKIILREIVCS